MAREIISEITKKTLDVDISGLHAIAITARCKSNKQSEIKEEENLRVEIDGMQFREIPPADRTQLFNIPCAWNGTALQDLSKTVVFLMFLKKGEHKLTFIPKPSATIETYDITPIHDLQN